MDQSLVLEYLFIILRTSVALSHHTHFHIVCLLMTCSGASGEVAVMDPQVNDVLSTAATAWCSAKPLQLNANKTELL